jgi:hypothetical protein
MVLTLCHPKEKQSNQVTPDPSLSDDKCHTVKASSLTMEGKPHFRHFIIYLQQFKVQPADLCQHQVMQSNRPGWLGWAQETKVMEINSYLIKDHIFLKHIFKSKGTNKTEKSSFPLYISLNSISSWAAIASNI